MIKKLLVFGTALAMQFSVATAQHNHTQTRACGAPSLEERIKNLPANRKDLIDKIEAHTNEFVAKAAKSKKGDMTQATTTGIVYKIPVVVHVVYNSNTPAQNISDAIIQSQIDVLNADFNRTNTDAGNTPSAFQGVAANYEIQFILAKVDPNGNATTGITRTQTPNPYFEYGGSDPGGVFVKQTAKGGKDAWPTDKYLNMWVCNFGGASSSLLGYATFPESAGTYKDGVVMGYKYFGVNPSLGGVFGYGRTATHEVGHWLNLRHIWGDASCGNDFVSDTPTQQTSNGGCPTYPKPTCGNTSDQFMNYMDYVNDQCMNMFSEGQKTRSRALFATGGARVSLLSSPGLGTPTGGGGTPTTPAYCASKGNSVADEYIKRVTLGTINNVTAGNAGYGNFTTLSTNLVRGTSNTITVAPGWTSTTYSEGYAVWIDYNKDGDFIDAGEQVLSRAATTALSVSGSFTVPTTAPLGTTRMRVSMKYNGTPTSCETFSFGEVEDYTVNITSTAASRETYDPATERTSALTQGFGIELYPNPAVGEATLRLSLGDAEGDVQLNVYNMQGRQFIAETVKVQGETKHTLNLQSLKAGVYFVAIQHGDRKEVKKLVITE